MTTTINPLTNAKVRIGRQQYGSFSIVPKVTKALQNSNHPELIEDFLTEVKTVSLGDYNVLVKVCAKYVTIS